MRVGDLFGKRTWIGYGVSLGVLLLMLLLGSLLTVREVLPMNFVSPWLWISYGTAALLGGYIAAAGKGRHMCAIVPGTMLYVTAWLFALCSECPITFAANGLGITVAVCMGMILALICRKGKKRSRSRKVKRPSARRIQR